MNELLPPQNPTDTHEPIDLISTFFASKTKLTIRAYERDLRDFQEYINAPSLEAAAKRLLGAGQDTRTCLDLVQGASAFGEPGPCTINRRLAALRSLVCWRVWWACALLVGGRPIKGASARDTRGPGHEGVKKMLALLVNRTDKKARRDFALLRLMFDLALRRGEVVSINREHMDLVSGGLWVMEKEERNAND